MNLPSLSTLPLITICIGSLTALASAQLPSDHYLVGTQGWVNSKISNALNTIQVISPYTGKASILNVTGLPPGEAPSKFHVVSPRVFLVGTKSLNTTTAFGNLYRVSLTAPTAWTAVRINTSPLPINVSDLVVSGKTAYVIGSSVFSNTGDDAQILRISLANGAVTTHIKLGNKFQKSKSGGSMGLGSSLVLLSGVLHVFTYDTTNVTPQYNEHWRVSTKTPVTARKLASLPSSRRKPATPTGTGFGTSGALVDPTNPKRLIVVGRWGEMVWRDLNGKDLAWEGFPGPVLSTSPTYTSELWRGVALNTNTHAIGLGDHDGASIDERRCANSPGAVEPFSNNIAKAVQPPLTGTVVSTIAGMVYIPGPSSYRPIGAGCPDGTNGIPCSYATSAPALGNQAFGFSLHARPKGVSPTTVGLLFISTKAIPRGLSLAPIAPGCNFYLNPGSTILVGTVGSLSNEISITGLRLPNTKMKVYTQWALSAPRANALGIILSDARRLQ